jgi:hypothetical protein
MRIFLLISLFCSTLLTAQEGDIDALIDEVVHAPQETRYEKMNAFKKQMRELNRQQREEALEALRARMNADAEPAAADAETTRTRTRTEEALRQQQMQKQRIQTQQRQQQQMKSAPQKAR